MSHCLVHIAKLPPVFVIFRRFYRFSQDQGWCCNGDKLHLKFTISESIFFPAPEPPLSQVPRMLYSLCCQSMANGCTHGGGWQGSTSTTRSLEPANEVGLLMIGLADRDMHALHRPHGTLSPNPAQNRIHPIKNLQLRRQNAHFEGVVDEVHSHMKRKSVVICGSLNTCACRVDSITAAAKDSADGGHAR